MFAITPQVDTNEKWADNGNIAGYDYDHTSLTERDAYQPMMLGQIPPNCPLIMLRVALLSPDVNKKVCFRHPDMNNDINISVISTQVANVPIERDIFVSCYADKVVDVLIETANWSYIHIVVRKWIVE